MKLRYLVVLPLLAAVPAFFVIPADAARPDPVLAFVGPVLIGPDGTDVLAATFETPLASSRWTLVVEAGADGAPAPAAMQVTLNGEVVLAQAGLDRPSYTVSVVLLPRGGGSNTITVSATGEAGARAMVAVGGKSLPNQALSALVFAGARDDGSPTGIRSLVTLFASKAPVLCWVCFIAPDGTFRGRTDTVPLPADATVTLNLGDLVQTCGFDWTEGAVRIVHASMRGTLVGRGMIVDVAADRIRDIPLERVAYP